MTEPTVDFNIDETTVSVNVVAQRPAIINYDVAVPYVTLVTQADWTEEDPNAKGYIWHKPVLSNVAISGSYNDLSDTPTIPSATSDLLNNSGFITKEVSDLLNYTLTSELATVAITGSYSDLLNTPSLPTSSDFIPQVPNTQLYQNKLAGSTITDSSNRVLPALNYAAGNGYIGFGLGDKYRHLLFTEYNATLYADTLNFKSEGTYTVNSKGSISLGYADNYNRKIMLDLVSTSTGAELLLRKDTSSTPILAFPTNDNASINLPKGLSILAQQSADSTINLISNGKIQIVNTSSGGIEIVKSAQSIKLQDSGKLSITNGSGQTEIVGTGGVSINGANNPISLTAGGGIALSGPNCTFNTVQVATVNDIPSLTGYATESYVNSAVSTHNSSNSAHTDIRTSIGAIEELIPTQASTNNQLADKNFVNSSIATSTATFRGTFNVVTDLVLHYNSTHSEIEYELDNLVGDYQIEADNNDYVFVQIPTSDNTPTEIASIERYKFAVDHFAYEYTLNNSGFTAAQWAAINSGITSSTVTAIIALINNIATVATSGDYNDLINKPTIPAAQIQSDWSQSDNTQLDFIKNKPTIPTVNDGATTLQLNGTTIGTFTANQSGSNTLNILAVPISPQVSNSVNLVAGKINDLVTDGAIDYADLALPANPGTAEYNGTFTSTTSGDITVSLPLTYWSGDTSIVTGKTYSFSIQNGVGFIIQLD